MANRKNKSSGKSSAKSASKSDSAGASKKETRDPAEVRAEAFRISGGRETVEAFVIAFMLALLFRAFLAEAFVIPTGSMAPALVGAHKDLICDRCGSPFQCGASRERSSPDMSIAVVAGICPNCRHVNALDLEGNKNHQTFNGDRIVVSKYSYVFGDPDRWDVVVFKYPGNPKQNYIKRCVGLPNETLTLQHGDVYMRPTGSNERDQILRKPADTLLAMRHLVYDTRYQSQMLIDANYPSRWQPWLEGSESPPSDSWSVQRSEDGLTATLAAGDDDRLHWLRYFHRWPDDQQWKVAEDGGSLADVDPYSSRLITDFYAYDSYVNVAASLVYEDVPTQRASPTMGGRVGRLIRGSGGGYSQGDFRRGYQSGMGPEQFGQNSHWGGQDRFGQQLGRDGMHWVGDLIFEADVETSADSKELVMKLVEAGINYRCSIDLKTGIATLSIDDDGRAKPFEAEAGSNSANPTAQTVVRAGQSVQLRFSNCDDQLNLWVAGDLVEFDRPTAFDARSFRSGANDRPYYSKQDPADAAPVAIAVRGGKSTIQSLRIDRDKYYIATDNANSGIYDYDLSKLRQSAGRTVSLREIQDLFTAPAQWSGADVWESRRSVTFELEEDQFFPMGDNSPESLDARCWAGSRPQFQMPRGVNEDAWRWSNDPFVPRELLVGKALVVFWPHSWNSPVPFTPNFKRMKLIR
jgi:signal peptidase I